MYKNKHIRLKMRYRIGRDLKDTYNHDLHPPLTIPAHSSIYS